MTISEFIAAQHEANNELTVPVDLLDGPDQRDFAASNLALDWLFAMADYALKQREEQFLTDSEKTPRTLEKHTRIGIAMALEQAFLFGVRCGRVVPERAQVQ